MRRRSAHSFRSLLLLLPRFPASYDPVHVCVGVGEVGLKIIALRASAGPPLDPVPHVRFRPLPFRERSHWRPDSAYA